MKTDIKMLVREAFCELPNKCLRIVCFIEDVARAYSDDEVSISPHNATNIADILLTYYLFICLFAVPQELPSFQNCSGQPDKEV